jgi:hypothetical protein
MPLIQYEDIQFSQEKLGLLAKANVIIQNYAEQGFNLTLRQLYYVFIGKDIFPEDWKYRNIGNNKWVKDVVNGTKNAPNNYTALGRMISDGRMAGLVDWDAIVDRTRTSYSNQHWQRPSQILEQVRHSYAIDKWKDQPHYCEVFVEKEALEQIVGRACQPLDVSFFSCKGYTSQSAMWEAAQRLISQREKGKQLHIIHLGDHDPSGIHMSADIFKRLDLFVSHNYPGAEVAVDVQRIALNIDQVRKYKLPPNWAKAKDPRFGSYREQFGDESWELDALEPALLVELIQKKILTYRDEVLWKEAETIEEKGRSTLKYICQYFPECVQFLRDIRTKDTSPIVCQECGATQAHPKCLCIGSEDPVQLLS